MAPAGIDMSSLALLIPQAASALYYGGGTNSTETVAQLNVTFQYTSTGLDNYALALVASQECESCWSNVA